jgi:hypothetical protein
MSQRLEPDQCKVVFVPSSRARSLEMQAYRRLSSRALRRKAARQNQRDAREK